jgi:hypothetical protein
LPWQWRERRRQYRVDPPPEPAATPREGDGGDDREHPEQIKGCPRSTQPIHHRQLHAAGETSTTTPARGAALAAAIGLAPSSAPANPVGKPQRPPPRPPSAARPAIITARPAAVAANDSGVGGEDWRLDGSPLAVIWGRRGRGLDSLYMNAKEGFCPLLLCHLLLGDVGGGILIVLIAGPLPCLPSSRRPLRSPPAKPIDAGEGGGGS